MWQKTVERSIQTRNPNRKNQSPSHPIPKERVEMTRKVELVAVEEEKEVEKLRAVAEETSFERLMVKKNMKRVKMTIDEG